jgi:hypothetical protein
MTNQNETSQVALEEQEGSQSNEQRYQHVVLALGPDKATGRKSGRPGRPAKKHVHRLLPRRSATPDERDNVAHINVQISKEKYLNIGDVIANNKFDNIRTVSDFVRLCVDGFLATWEEEKKPFVPVVVAGKKEDQE